MNRQLSGASYRPAADVVLIIPPDEFSAVFDMIPAKLLGQLMAGFGIDFFDQVLKQVPEPDITGNDEIKALHAEAEELQTKRLQSPGCQVQHRSGLNEWRLRPRDRSRSAMWYLNHQYSNRFCLTPLTEISVFPNRR